MRIFTKIIAAVFSFALILVLAGAWGAFCKFVFGPSNISYLLSIVGGFAIGYFGIDIVQIWWDHIDMQDERRERKNRRNNAGSLGSL